MLVDTSGLFAILAPDEPHHQLGCQWLLRARSPVVHSYVFAELVALFETRRKPRQIALDFIQTAIDNRELKIVWLTEGDFRQALALLHARPDKQYSLCDAASFVIMRRMNIREALTTDRHFEQEGFVRLLK